MRAWSDRYKKEWLQYRSGSREMLSAPAVRSCSSPSCSDNPAARAVTPAIRLDFRFWGRQLLREQLREPLEMRADAMHFQSRADTKLDRKARELERQGV